MSEKKSIFKIEQKAFERAQAVLNDGQYKDNSLMPEFSVLFDSYERMYRQFRSLIKISDYQQNRLNELNKELSESNTSKDKFFSIISHDLRGPLASLIGLSELLQERIEDYEDKDAVNNIAKQVYSSAKSLYALLENLLTWSRIQRDAIEYRPEILEIDEIVRFNMGLFTSWAERKQIRLRSSIARGTVLHADYNVLNTVFRNIVSNAIKFTPCGGMIEISARQNDDNTIELAVSDTGMGIRQENISKLFRIDAQYSKSGTAGEKGTGLGLILCKELLDKSGGSLWVESDIQTGTTVRFKLPGTFLQKNSLPDPLFVAVSEKTEQNITTAPAAYRMLVVDDASANRQILVNMLRSFGFRCREACNGREAMNIWESWLPHLVWMDIRMPLMNGYDAVKQIKSTSKGRNTIVIAVTGSISEKEHEAAFAAGFESIVFKPFKKSEITAILQNYLRIPIDILVVNKEKKADENICREQEMVISDAIRKRLPEIISRLETEIMPIWKELHDVFFVNDITDFATEVKKFAAEYHMDVLADYGEKLYGYAQINELEQMEKYMAFFPELIDKIIKK